MIEHLFHELSQLPQVEAIALGGSRAGSIYDEKSDYDIYLYCIAPIPEETRREIIGKYCSYVEYGNHFWELEDNGTFLSGIDFDLLYRSLPDFVKVVASVVEDCNAHNGYTTCMWHNLRTCKIVFDRHGNLSAAKSRFDIPYPARLKENIISQNLRLLRGSMPAYNDQIRKAVRRSDIVSMNHRTSAFLDSYFDILFALNEQTHPGEKRQVFLCRETCPILPEHFEENVQALLAHLFVHPEKTEENLENIIRELEKILPISFLQ